MSIVSLLNVKILNNPARFTDPYEFEITFECLEPLKEDLEWKVVYVGSSTSPDHDQELESLLVGPVPVGVNSFQFTADAPSPDLIPQAELVSVTVLLLTCSYREKEFVQVGYYVNNEYDTEELRENPPTRVALDHVVRNLLAEKPRVTRFNIPWDSEEKDANAEPGEIDMEDNDDDDENEEDEEEEEETYGNEDEDAQDEEIDEADADEADEEDDDDDENENAAEEEEEDEEEDLDDMEDDDDDADDNEAAEEDGDEAAEETAEEADESIDQPTEQPQA